MSSPAEPRTGVRPRDAAGFALFLVFWLFPCAYQGLAGRRPPMAPPVMTYLTSVSCLFTMAAPYAAFDYIQVQLTPGGSWVTIPDSPFFRMSPFGYRTRLDEYQRQGLFGERAQDEFAVWFYRRFREVHPDRPPIAGVRLVAGIVPTSLDVAPGRWRKPPLESLPPGVPRVWMTRTFAR